ncbi:MAG: DUF1800 family protein, partial [Verrucomicrobiales bacterium]
MKERKYRKARQGNRIRSFGAAMVLASMCLPLSRAASIETDEPGWAKAAGPESWVDDLTPISPADWSYQRAAHLLERAGFGGTPDEIRKLAAMTPEEAVAYLVDFQEVPNVPLPEFEHSGIWKGMFPGKDEHLAFDQIMRKAWRTGGHMGAKAGKDRSKPLWLQPINDLCQYSFAVSPWEWDRAEIWLANRALQTRRPLEEKLALFWHAHIPIEVHEIEDYRLMLQQFELFRKHANGNFGELLKGVNRNPGMLIYLDGRSNVKTDTNENYAREIFELFGLGVGNYTEQDIAEAARALTGWKVYGLKGWFKEEDFDNGEKTILGKTGNFNDEDVVDIILEQPACARFISAKLYKFFVRGDLSEEVNEELAALLRDENYEIKPVLKQLFLSRDFYSPATYARQIKSPVQFMVSSYKKLGLREAPGTPYLPKTIERLGQGVGGPPNVAGWPGDKDSGISWLNPSTLYQRANVMRHLLEPDTAGRRYWQLPRPPNKEAALKIRASGKGSDAMKMMSKDGKTMSPTSMKLMQNQDASNTLGVYNAYVMINERVKRVPVTGAEIDLATMLKDAGVINAID